MKLLCKILLILFICPQVYAYSSKIDVTNNAFMHNTRGTTLLHEKKYNGAISEFMIGIRLLPDNPIIHPIYNNLGIAYLELAKISKDYDKRNEKIFLKHAENSFLHALNFYPPALSYYENLVETYALMGVLDKKKVEYKKNKSLYSPIIVAMIYKKQGKTIEAQAIINDFVSKNPDLIMIKNLEKYFE